MWKNKKTPYSELNIQKVESLLKEMTELKHKIEGLIQEAENKARLSDSVRESVECNAYTMIQEVINKDINPIIEQQKTELKTLESLKTEYQDKVNSFRVLESSHHEHILLLVGDSYFHTSKHTLTNRNSIFKTMFAKDIDGKQKLEPIEGTDNCYRIEGDPEFFGTILRYLRTGYVSSSLDARGRSEFRYYKINIDDKLQRKPKSKE